MICPVPREFNYITCPSYHFTNGLIKSTLPIIQSQNVKMVQHFYDRMFQQNPEIKDLFSMTNPMTNQAQRQALFDGLIKYSMCVGEMTGHMPDVHRITQKHVSLGINPEQFQILGHHFIKTIEEILNPGVEVLEAWRQTYQSLSEFFVKRETEIKKELESSNGGWIGTRDFKLVEKTMDNIYVSTFIFEPVDQKEVVQHRPGQYLSFFFKDHPSFTSQEIRQYSISGAPNSKNYRFSIKREDQGLVSRLLIDELKVGDTVQLSPPCGDFYIDVDQLAIDQTPIALVSGGIGLTPLLSMLSALKKRSYQGQVSWIHACYNREFHSQANDVVDCGLGLPNFTSHLWYGFPTPNFPSPVQATSITDGHIDVAQVTPKLHPQTHYYLCGSIWFLKMVVKQLLDLKIQKQNIHYEIFGNHVILDD